jgi:hypothetical protein
MRQRYMFGNTVINEMERRAWCLKFGESGIPNSDN